MVLKAFFTLFNNSSGRLDGSLFDLRQDERWWRDRYTLLESHGYQLRERLRPGWIPSWTKDTSLDPELCEDSIFNDRPQITEATRIRDGSKVILKKVAKNSNEKAIALYLSSHSDENNHCIPVIDTFADLVDDSVEFMVMPLLRMFNSPPFHTVDEVIDFMRQTLKGIAFIHSKNVAHRDCSDFNIMLDGRELYPDGFHPIRQKMKCDGINLAKFCRRSETRGIRYYFIDFGLSTQFESSENDRLVTGCVCQVDVPELSDVVPYDPFAVDVYLLGDVYMRHFIDTYTNTQFLRPLVDSMITENPKGRPEADGALDILERLVSQRTVYSLRWRLIDRKLGRIPRLIINLKCISNEGFLLAGRILRIRRNGAQV